MLVFGLAIQIGALVLNARIIGWLGLANIEQASPVRLLPAMCAVSMIGLFADTLAAAVFGLNRSDLANYAQLAPQLAQMNMDKVDGVHAQEPSQSKDLTGRIDSLRRSVGQWDAGLPGRVFQRATR